MPVYNESPERVVAGVRATLESLCEQKTDGRYDLHILSDTTAPEIWLAEDLALSRHPRDFAGRDHVHYRHRPSHLARQHVHNPPLLEHACYLYPYMVVTATHSQL